jgi:Ca2+-binding RTX toxin-like protein
VHRAGDLDGGSGVDQILYTSSEPTASLDLRAYTGIENATAFRGTVIGTDGPNRLILEDNGTIFGGGGNDTLTGGQGRNELFGEGGNDVVSGNQNDDMLDGGSGADTLDGGVGVDTLLNGEVVPPPGQIRIVNRILTTDGSWGGEDITIARVGIDNVMVRIDGLARQFDMDDFDGVLLRGNNGYDRLEILDALTSPLARQVTLDGGNGNDTLFGSEVDDVLRGGAGDDMVVGFDGSDALFGGAGNDFVQGSGGSDFLDGGDGNDVLNNGDNVRDTVLGGNGNDLANRDPNDQITGVERFT